MKFKIGNRIRIIAVCEEEEMLNGKHASEFYIGKTGIIKDIDDFGDGFPYEIKFDNAEMNDGDNIYWQEKELELI